MIVSSLSLSSTPSSSITFDHLLDGLQRNEALQHQVLGPYCCIPPPSNNVIQQQQQQQASSQYPRLLVQQLGVLTGQLCAAFMHVPWQVQEQQAYFAATSTATTTVHPTISTSMVHVLLGLIQLAHVLKIDLHWAILQKMELNNRKYPVELCKGKAGKYTAYSQVTGITKTEGQVTRVLSYRPTPEKAPRSTSEHGSPTSVVDMAAAAAVSSSDDNIDDDYIDDDNSIANLQLRIRQFALDRQWQQYHQPRNLVLALMGEYGELAELFQWRHDDDLMKWDDDEEEDTTSAIATTTTTTTSTMPRLCRDKVQQEIADVAIYLLRLADVCNISLDLCAWRQVMTTTTTVQTTTTCTNRME